MANIDLSKFKSMAEISAACRKSSGRRSKGALDAIYLSEHKTGGRSDNKSIAIGIGLTVANKARLLEGDMVDVLVDPTSKKWLIRRLPVQNNGNYFGYRVNNGSKNVLYIKFMRGPGHPHIKQFTMIENGDIAIDATGIWFTARSQNVEY